VDAARPGDTIMVRQGTYHETVVIRTDGLTLRGAGAGKTILEPPATPNNGCGICVFGQGDPFGAAPPTGFVSGDRISRLTVRNFAFSGVFGWGTDRLAVSEVDAVDNGGYGISRFESRRTLFEDNRASGSGEAGFYVGDSPDAATTVTGNQAWGNDIGFFVRHAHGVTVSDNRSWGNCFGVLVLDDGQPGGAGDVKIRDNQVSGNNRFCPATEDTPPHGGGGVVLLGAVRTRVWNNDVTNNNIAEASAIGRGGVVVASAADSNGADASQIVVKDNEIRRNSPADIVWDGKGTGNRFRGNDCGTSIPTGFCHRR
jgi:nitrous oxidase accessory protein NosD